MISFAKTIAASLAVLGLLALVCSRIIPAYHLAAGGAGLMLMALNALAAVAFLRTMRGGDVFRGILASMAARLLTLAALMMAAMVFLKPTQAQAFSFVFTAMVGYLAFQALEIRHLIRSQNRPQGVAA